MTATIQKIGNSKGIRIPKRILEDADLNEHDTVKIIKVNEGIFIKKITPTYQSLDEVFEGYEGNYKCGEWDFGEDVGRENIW